MLFHAIRRTIRVEEALLLVALTLLLALRVWCGASYVSVHSLTERIVVVFKPSFAVVIFVFIVAPFMKNWFKTLWASTVSNRPAPYRMVYATLGRSMTEMLRFFRGYLPFMLIVAIYDSFTSRYTMDGFNLTRSIVKNDLTHLLIKADEMMFGTQTSYLTQKYITAQLTDLMYVGYALHFIFPLILATSFYLKKREDYFRELILAVVVVSCIGYVGYLMFPSMSPLYVLSYETDLYGGRISDLVASEIARVRSEQRDCCLFPSLHVGISTVTLILAYRRDKKLFLLLAPFIVLSWASTVYLRRHFVIDIIAGWVTAWIAVYVTPRINEWWYGTKGGNIVSGSG